MREENNDGGAREAPHNIQAEQALLGAILINPGAFERVSDILEEGHFFDPLHGQIYETIEKLAAAGRSATPITLRTFFENHEPITQDLTVPQYLGRLAASAVTIISVRDYAMLIRDLAARRSLIMLGEDIVLRAYDSPPDDKFETQIEDAERDLYAIASGRAMAGGGEQHISVFMRGAMDSANSARMSGSGMSGIPTGLTSLDRMMGGLTQSDLIVLAGRPSMGKTALAMNVAFNTARREMQNSIEEDRPAKNVLIFSLEMSGDQVAARAIADLATINSAAMRRGDITDSEFQRAMSCATEASDLPFYIDQTGGISIAQMTARARRFARRHGVFLIIVDYLQLMSGSGNRSDNRVQEITAITTGLKALAKELNVPVIALSQLSRAVETRQDKRPQLSDLRESGSIEQDADVVMFVFRDDYYLSRSAPDVSDPEYAEWQRKMSNSEGKAEVIIGKQRHGPTGTVYLAFEAAYTRFTSLADDTRYGGDR